MLRRIIDIRSQEKGLRNGRFYDLEDVNIPYWNETAIVRMKCKGSESLKHILNVYPVVRIVLNLKGETDYGYIRDSEPHLKSWLIRPNVNRVIQELEKTIFILS